MNAALLLAAILLAVNTTGLCPCIYYGDLTPSVMQSLSPCSVLVLPPTTPIEVVKRLSSSRIVLGYISVATIGDWEPWANMVPDSLIIGENRVWQEKIVNVCSGEWRKIFEYAVDYVLDHGFNGVFLDNLDIVDEYPWMKKCIVELVRSVKERYPHAVVMVNRGFTILPDIADSIDYLLVEAYPTYYDFEHHVYRTWSGSDLEWIVSQVRRAVRLGEQYGFRVVALAYGDPGDNSVVDEICRIIEEYTPGLPVYIAPWTLAEPGKCLQCGTVAQGEARQAGGQARSFGAAPTTAKTRTEPVGVEAGPPLAAVALLAGAAAGALLITLLSRRKRRQ